MSYSSSTEYFPVTPSDTTVFNRELVGLYIGGSGDVTVIEPVTGLTVVFKNLIAGTILPIRTKRVMATGTTATYIVAL